MEPTSPEPSMEDILASIKRIIAEEPPVAEPSRPTDPGRRPISFADADSSVDPDVEPASSSAADAAPVGGGDEGEAPGEDLLELTSAVAEPSSPTPSAADHAPPPTLVSDDAAIASRQALATLSAMVVKPGQGADNTLEGLVREMLRPVLKEWLDARLPDIVERLVALEISRITSRGG